MRIHRAEELYPESRFKWLLLLLALLINLAILFILFIINIENDFWQFPHLDEQQSAPVIFQDMPEIPEQPPEIKPDEVAALKPGASQFGRPDEFDEQEFTATLPESEKLQEEPEESELTQEENEEASLEKLLEKKQPEPKVESITYFEKPQELLKTQTAVMVEHETKPKFSPEAQKEKKKDIHQQSLENPPQKIRAPLKKELTFNDIAQGFLASLDEGGNDLIERKGNENIRPDFEEMRTLSYLHKIIWYMQNEWRRDTSLMDCPIPAMVVTGVSITIDKEGNLKKASVVQSCGIHQLDEAVLRGIKAASPYPSLPSHFKKDSYTVEFGVKHMGNNLARNRMNFYLGR
jgi:TonB family protein